jgi:GLPGLI family protein
MKPKKILFVLLTISFNCLIAQTGKVIYKSNNLNVSRATNNVNGQLKGELYFTDSLFMYNEINPEVRDGAEVKKENENVGEIKISSSDPYVFEFIHYNYSRLDFISERVFINKIKYQKKDSIPNWEFVDEKKQIGKYTCQKAITKYCGRIWIVWFTTELPYPYGPWKLHGLPGLIMEAIDADKKYSFEFESISMPTIFIGTKFLEEVKNGSITLQYPEYINRKKKYYSNLEAKASTIGNNGLTQGTFKIAETRDIDF